MFNKNSYDQNDRPAKEAVSGFLQTRGNKVLESLFDADLSIRNAEGKSFGIECERR